MSVGALMQPNRMRERISTPPPERGHSCRHSCPQRASKADTFQPRPGPFGLSNIAADRNVRAPDAPRIWEWRNRMLPLLALLACCGCRSLNQPASASFASVVIVNRTVEEIRLATAAVFTEAGYETFHTAKGDMVFEKEGTKMNQIAHGGWLEDGSVRERVRTTP